jgi:polysaccharide biosynthesis transport protein
MDMAENERLDALSFRTVLRALRRRLGVVVVCAVLVPAAALALSLTTDEKYSASASLLFRDSALDQQLFGTPLFTEQDADRQAATNQRLVSLDVVTRSAAERLGGTVTTADLDAKLDIESDGQSDVITITATDQNPRLAAEYANVFAHEYVELRQEADREKAKEAQLLVERSLSALTPAEREQPRGRLLREHAQQLETLAALQTGGAEVVQEARIPSSPSSPKPVRNTVLGAVLGLILGVGLALVLDRLDRRIRDPKEVEEAFDRPILGAIPDSTELERSGPTQPPDPHVAEAFRMLRANLRYFNIDHRIQSVLVTSAAPGDGKTTVAWNLAAAAAGAGARALLIEADLRHPALAYGLGLQRGPGLSTVLADEAAMSDAIQEIPVPERGNGRAPRTVDALLAGPLPPNPSDLLESHRMHDVIAEAEQAYDLVVIDTPPTSVVSDAVPLVPRVGGVIVVTRLAKTTREAMLHLRNQLQNLDASVLGVVVNALGSEGEKYGYGYGYDYAYDARGRYAEREGSAR